jgi:nitroimidazol reductase NimA-like FMN-containing flavoprotein (pyridoxamine 5'-phosphate oxidase superfamily)
MTVEELENYGMKQMSDDQIRQILSTQDVGILGLPAEEAPSMRPLTFWFDGSDTIYFVYVVGSQSRKVDLSERADLARFLVYRIETTFNWRSALFTGTIDEVPDSQREAIESEMEIEWQPEVFERAKTAEDIAVYRFAVDEWSGIKHTGLPPGFEADDE